MKIELVEKIYNMDKKERSKLGFKGRKHVEKNYNFENYKQRWIETMVNIYEKHGSWATRKNYNSWAFDEVA